MGSGGGDGGVTQIPGGPINNVPLQDNLTSAALNMLTQSLPYSPMGAGYQGLPRVPQGQVYMPGPNPSIFGDPFNASYAQSFFGPNSGSAPPGMAPGGGGGMGQPTGPQAPAQPQGNGAPPQQQPQQIPGVQPGGQVHPAASFLSQLLAPGVLGNLFSHMQQTGMAPSAGQPQQPQQPQAQQQQPQQQGG